MKKQTASKRKNKKAKMITGVVLAPVAVGIVATTNMQFEASADTVFIDIHNAAELQAIKDNPKGSYRLVNDIDLTGVNWTPFVFSGVLDGNDFTIKNLKLSIPADNQDNQGLFSTIDKNATVKNLKIDNFNITSNSRKIGALAGFTENATIENVKVINSMVKGFRDVGILIGKTQGTTVKRVMTEGTVKGEMAVGGLIGSSSVSLSLENVYTNAKVDSTISHSGGVIGFTQNIVSMKSVYSTSAVTGKNLIGGVIGSSNYAPDLTDTYALNTLVEGTGTDIGNFIGASDRPITSSTIALEDIKGNSSNRYLTQVINQANVEKGLVGFEDSSIWKQDPTTKLPIFVEQSAFPGEVPTYDSKPQVLMDEEGFFKPIYTSEELKYIEHNNINGTDRYKLMNDIDLESVVWTPFTLSTQLDGNGFAIKNLKLSIPADNQDNQGLFSTIDKNATVKNLTIDNFNITSNSRKIGALAGFTENATIENVKVINSMVKGFRDVGILIGKTQGTTVKRVMTEGTVKGEMAVGGLIGSSSVSLSLENVYTNAKVDSTISHSGGVIGFTQNIVSMKSVYSTSAVTGINLIGGVIGSSNYAPDLTDTYALNTLVEGTGTYVGNFIGATDSPITSKPIAREDIRGNGSNEHTNRLITQTDVEKGLVGFEDTSIWKQDETTKLPIFIDQDEFPGDIPIYIGSKPIIPTPKQFKVTERGYNDLTLSWQVKNNDMIEGFKITRDGQEIAQVPFDANTEKYVYKDKNLMHDTSYDYEITVMYQDDLSKPAKLIESTLAVDKPTTVKLKKATEKSVSFTWDPVDIATEYIILRNDVEIARVTEPSFMDEGLKPSTSYEYKVITVSPYGNSQPTEITAKTSDKIDVPNPKIDAAIKEKEVVVSWDNFEEFYQKDISHYRVVIEKKNENGDFEQVDTPMELKGKSHTFNSLDPNTEYRITVTPQIDGDYNEDHAVSKVIRTLKEEEDMPTVLNVTATTSNKDVIVKWDTFEYKGVPSTRYRVQRYIKLEDGTFVKDGFARATTTNQLVVTGLTEGKEYYFEVTPQVSNTYKDEFNGISNKISFELPPIEVVKPVTNVVASLNEKTAEITWDEFAIKGNTSTRYRVQVYEKDTVTGDLVKKGAAVTVNENSYFYNKLEDGKTYQFMITPQANGTYNEAYSTISNEITFALQPVEVPPGEVGGPKVTNVVAAINEKTAEITWDEFVIKGNTSTRYRVQAYEKDMATGALVRKGTAVAVTGNSYAYNKLVEGKTYQFMITPQANGTYNESYSNHSNEVTYGVRATFEGTSVMLDWDEVADVTHYKVEKYKFNAKQNKYELDGYGVSTEKNTHAFSVLEENTKYKFVIIPRLGYVYDSSSQMTTTALLKMNK